MSDRIDFFINYAHTDKQWAEWISFCLEKNDYTTFFYDRDLQPGQAFPLTLMEMLEKANGMIAILSPLILLQLIVKQNFQQF